MPVTWRSWTSKEIAKVVEMRGDGKTTKEIGITLGRSSRGVDRKCHELGIPKVRWLSLRWLEQFKRDPSPTVAATHFGVSIHAAKKWKWRLRKAGWNVKGQY